MQEAKAYADFVLSGGPEKLLRAHTRLSQELERGDGESGDAEAAVVGRPAIGMPARTDTT